MTRHSMQEKSFLGSALLLVTATYAGTCSAAVTISAKKTTNMTCSGGVCTPTATKAILNAADLQTMLASGSVEVTTTGSGVQASDIDVTAPVKWSASSSLVLDAYHSIAVDDAISVKGMSGMSLVINDGGAGGTLWFSSKGHIAFDNLSSQLSINGTTFTLAGDIKTLASDIGANSSGNFALANSYNAENDGTYTSSPLPGFGGIFTGLGNTISNLSINDTTAGDYVGLFQQVYANGGTVQNLNMQNPSISGPAGTASAYAMVGAVAGGDNGLLFNDSVTGGSVSSSGEYAGVGGVAGIVYAYGASPASAADCYSTASVATTSENTTVGDLVGVLASSGAATAKVSQSYATGTVPNGNGGFVCDAGDVRFLDDYWDVTTSGATFAACAGESVADVAGLTTEELKSGLPVGFDRNVWTQKPGINHGYPYLIDNPPE